MPNNSDNTSSITQSFRKDVSDEPEVFIQKMKNTLKKKKNNYKNIEELENIYETVDNSPTTFKPSINKSSKKSREHTNELTDSFEQFSKDMDDFKKNMTSIFTPMDNNEGNSSSPETDTKTSKKTKTEKSVYLPDYEYENKNEKKLKKEKYARLLDDAKNGTVNIAEIKNLLNTGQITQAQYNTLFGFSLPGFDWQNINTSPPKKPECGKFNKDCGASANSLDYFKKIMEIIKQLINLYSQLLNFIASKVYLSTNSNSESKDSTLDISIIAKILNYIIMVPFAIFFAYNWFYITFYRDESGNPLKIDFENDVMSSLKGLLERLFKCLVRPMILQDLLRNLISGTYYAFSSMIKNGEKSIFKESYIGRIIENPTVIFISLVFIILFMIPEYSDKISNALFSYMNDKKVPYEGYLHGIIAYDWIVGFAAVGIIGKYATFISSLLSPLTTVFWFLVLVIFSHVMIRFSGIFMILYLYVMSYFALTIYSPGGFFNGYNTINTILKNATSGKNKSCPPNQKDDMITKIIKMCYNYLWSFIYLIVCIVCLTMVLGKISSASSKIALSSVFSMLVAIISFYLVYNVQTPLTDDISKKDIDIPPYYNPFEKSK